MGFDTLCAMKVIELRKKYPHIKLILVLPCIGQTKSWNVTDIQRYEWIKSQADKIQLLSKTYDKGCMHMRNRHLVNNSAYCICYLHEARGGTAYTVAYAEKMGITIIRI